MPLSEEIAKMEYDRLSKEIVSISDEANQLARYAVISAAVICGAIVTTRDLPERYIMILKALPAITTLLFGFRVLALFSRLMTISKYFEEAYEKNILKQDFAWLGWETHLNNIIRNKDSKQKHPRWSVGIFWFTLLLLCIIFIFL